MSREHPTFCDTCGKMNDGGDFYPDETDCRCVVWDADLNDFEAFWDAWERAPIGTVFVFPKRSPAPDANDREWADERDAICQRFYGLTADQFARQFKSGTLPPNDGLERVLMLFPELD